MGLFLSAHICAAFWIFRSPVLPINFSLRIVFSVFQISTPKFSVHPPVTYGLEHTMSREHLHSNAPHVFLPSTEASSHFFKAFKCSIYFKLQWTVQSHNFRNSEVVPAHKEVSEEIPKLTVELYVDGFLFFFSKCYYMVFMFYFSSLNAVLNPTLPRIYYDWYDNAKPPPLMSMHPVKFLHMLKVCIWSNSTTLYVLRVWRVFF